MRHATNRHTSTAVFEYSYNSAQHSARNSETKNNGIKKIKKRPSNVEQVGC